MIYTSWLSVSHCDARHCDALYKHFMTSTIPASVPRVNVTCTVHVVATTGLLQLNSELWHLPRLQELQPRQLGHPRVRPWTRVTVTRSSTRSSIAQ
jgi:hypothetical protein